MPEFLPGLALCRLFYTEAVRPLLDEAYPGLRYAAARVGPGSEVLGFDTPRSVDHDWGPRLELFLSPHDVARYAGDISALLSARLPAQVHGWSTHFVPVDDGAVRVMGPTSGSVAHLVRVTDVAAWSVQRLGFDARAAVRVQDWLATPTQLLAETTGGAVFHDDPGELTGLRARLRWYPDDVWRYVLAAAWTRIAQEEAFVGRTAEAGDALGGRVVAARLAREVMRLCLLLGRRYPPYSKWLGTAFATLPDIGPIAAVLLEATGTADPGRREGALCTAYEAVGRWQNGLGLARPVEATRRPFFNRPYQVIDAARFASALLERVEDPVLAALPRIGAIDQYVDCTDLLGRPRLTRTLTGVVCGSADDPGERPN